MWSIKLCVGIPIEGVALVIQTTPVTRKVHKAMHAVPHTIEIKNGLCFKRCMIFYSWIFVFRKY